jgi:3-oxoacyl-[acyl-carrier-protein] synthase II
VAPRAGRSGGFGDRPPVSICGVGAVTGYGWGRKLLWDGLMSGESAVVPNEGYGEQLGMEVVWGAPVPPGGDPSDGHSRFARALRFAAREAVEDARERGWAPGPVVGVIHSAVLGDVESWSDFYRSQGRRATSRRWVQLMPSTAWSALMKEHDFHGPCMSVSAMCASGSAGLLTAKMWLDAGIASDVLLVATDISGRPENLRFFRDLGVMALDRPGLDACRPFQEGSRGFPGGEASVAMVVSCRPGGAYASVLGGAMTHDGHHAISIAPDHREIMRCFRQALESARVGASDVAYLNAHGPGTAQCDAAEARVLDELLPQAKGIFSIKPLTGHCQGAASAVELLASLHGFEYGVIPAPPKVARGHPRLLDGPTLREPGLMLKSSIGMGGHNAVVVLDEPSA